MYCTSATALTFNDLDPPFPTLNPFSPTPFSHHLDLFNLPPRLPPRPRHIQPVKLRDLEFLDSSQDLKDVPEAFLRDVLACLAPHLLEGVQSTSILADPLHLSSSHPPPTITCLLHPSPTAIQPTHVLLLPTAQSTSSSSAAPALSPLHALPFALASTTFTRILQASAYAKTSPTSLASGQGQHSRRAEGAVHNTSTRSFDIASPPYPSPALTPTFFKDFSPSSAPPPSPVASSSSSPIILDLPVLSFPPSFPLPDRYAFEHLYRWVYSGGDVDELWASLIYPSFTDEDADEGEEAERRDEDEEARDALRRIAGVWRAAVALEMGDEELWRVLDAAWETTAEGLLRWREEEEETGRSEGEDVDEVREGAGHEEGVDFSSSMDLSED